MKSNIIYPIPLYHQPSLEVIILTILEFSFQCLSPYFFFKDNCMLFLINFKHCLWSFIVRGGD